MHSKHRFTEDFGALIAIGVFFLTHKPQGTKCSAGLGGQKLATVESGRVARFAFPACRHSSGFVCVLTSLLFTEYLRSCTATRGIVVVGQA